MTRGGRGGVCWGMGRRGEYSPPLCLYNSSLICICRRRSFHDLESVREVRTRALTAERMRVDVELCGQLLVMARREPHLERVLACLQVCLPPFVRSAREAP
jgi:hypothetical protein